MGLTKDGSDYGGSDHIGSAGATSLWGSDCVKRRLRVKGPARICWKKGLDQMERGSGGRPRELGVLVESIGGLWQGAGDLNTYENEGHRVIIGAEKTEIVSRVEGMGNRVFLQDGKLQRAREKHRRRKKQEVQGLK